MPAKSKAQFRKMGALYREGKITRAQLKDFNEGVHPKDLPEHVASRKNPLKGTRQPRGRKEP